MNRIKNIWTLKRLKNGIRNFSYVKKFDASKNTANSFFLSLKNYCTTLDLEHSQLITKEVFDKITKKDPVLERKIKLLLLEIESFRAEGHLVPSKIPERHWEEYLLQTTTREKLLFMKYIMCCEVDEEEERLRRELLEQAHQAKIRELNLPGHIEYGFGKNSYFLEITRASFDPHLNMKLLAAQYFKNYVIIDLGFENHMYPRQIKNCARQLRLALSHNRIHQNPYYVHLCNFPGDTLLFKYIKNHSIDNPNLFPLTIHKDSYLNHFSKDRLVYLTTNSPNDFIYDPNDIYIIGGFVDAHNEKPISYGKAKAEKLRTARFPLDQYLSWKRGSKSLTIDIAMRILLDYQHSRNWKVAFRHVPRRFTMDLEELREMNLRRLEKKNNYENVRRL